MDGSHSPGGRTVTASRNSSKPTIYNVVFIQTKLKGVGRDHIGIVRSIDELSRLDGNTCL